MRLHSKLAGYYKIDRVVNPGTALEYKVPIIEWFPNLILNTGLDLFGFIPSGIPYYMTYCRVGSGNDTPTVSDLELESQLGYTSTVQSTSQGNSSSPLYYRWAQLVYRFGPGVATGNISEVGVGSHHINSGTLFSRALILDSYGNPTTITKLSDETLDVTYEFRVYPRTSDFTGSVTLTGNKGATYNYTGRTALASTPMQVYLGKPNNLIIVSLSIQTYTGSLGTITNVPSTPISGGSSTNTASSYTNGTFNLNTTHTFDLNVSNHASGIKSLQIQGTQANWQIEFNTAIMKTSSDVLVLNLNTSWGRY